MEAELAKIHVPLLYTRIWQLVAVDYGALLRRVTVHLCTLIFCSCSSGDYPSGDIYFYPSQSALVHVDLGNLQRVKFCD